MRCPLPALIRLILTVFLITVMLVAPAVAQSAGALFETSSIGSGARAMGMGGAFVAVADDATAASWNPAGLSLLVRPEVSFVQDFTRLKNNLAASSSSQSNLSATIFRSSFSGFAYTANARDPEFFSVTYPVARGRWRFVPQFSYRRAIKRNLAYQYTRDQVTENPAAGTRTSSTTSVTFDSDGGIDVYAASVGVNFDPRWNIGVAVNLWRGDWDSRSVSSSTLATSTSSTAASEKTSGTSTDVGVLFKPTRRFAVGAVLRTRFTLQRDATSDNQIAYTVPVAPTSTSRTTSELDADVKWPLSVSFGASVSPIDALVVSADYTKGFWSDATISGTSTTITAFQPGGPVPRTTTSTVNSTYPFAALTYAPQTSQQDSYQARGGAEYTMRRSSSGNFIGIPVRAGLFRDKSMQPQLDGSALVSNGITVGGGLLWRRLSIDGAYVHESIKGLVTASTNFEVTTGVTTLVRSDESSSTFGRFILSSTVRF
jgi:long-subunit fatty acid transport protein